MPTRSLRAPVRADHPDSDGLRNALGELFHEAERLRTEAPFTGEAVGAAEAVACDDLVQERKLAYLMAQYARTYAAYRELGRGGPEASHGALSRWSSSGRGRRRVLGLVDPALRRDPLSTGTGSP